MLHRPNRDVVDFVHHLAEVGSNYRMDEMAGLYADDLGFLVLTKEGEIARFSKETMMTEFRTRRDAGETPLSTEKRILHVEEQGDDATVILYRRMSRRADAAFYELRLRKIGGSWLVVGETVLPWPDLRKARGFLPPREKGL